MVIKFKCPKGHKLSCPDDRVGRRGKCPECQTLFEVPKPTAGEEGAGSKVYASEQIIEFYCPNEHYLTAPARLTGKRGQCPHCGATFRVPQLEGEDGAPKAPTDGALPSSGGSSKGSSKAQLLGGAAVPSMEIEEIETVDEVQEQIGQIEEIEEIEEVRDEDTLLPPAPGEYGHGSYLSGEHEHTPYVDPATGMGSSLGKLHPLAVLFERLWLEAEREAVIEVQLANGDKIIPLDFSHDMSRGQHGVFAIQERDGSSTVIVTPWDNVTKVSVRGLKELPSSIFN